MKLRKILMHAFLFTINILQTKWDFPIGFFQTIKLKKECAFLSLAVEPAACGLEKLQKLKNDGTFYAATYGEHGIIEYCAELLRDFGITDTTNKNFTLQNGESILTLCQL